MTGPAKQSRSVKKNDKDVKFPKACIERFLKFLDELAVTIFKAARPIVQNVPIVSILLGINRTKIRMLQLLADDWREETHSNCSLRLFFAEQNRTDRKDPASRVGREGLSALRPIRMGHHRDCAAIVVIGR
jgi:hypothetical protein